MEAAELKNFSVEELRSRIRQWRDELFRSKFKSESSEAKDTSIFKKLRRDIARAHTVLTTKLGNGELGIPFSKPKTAAPAEDKAAEPKKETTKGRRRLPGSRKRQRE